MSNNPMRISTISPQFPAVGDDEPHPDQPPDDLPPTPSQNQPPSLEQRELGLEATSRPSSTEPPPYQDTLDLLCTTSAQSRRYEKKLLRNLPSHSNIPPGLFALVVAPNKPVPGGWVELIHPEGQNYFYNPSRRIVTEANIREFENLRQILHAAGRIDGILAAQEMALPNSSELMLELGDEYEEPNVVRYYFVDHRQKTEFWLDSTATDKLDLPPITSMNHLKHLLQQHYWNHIEFFPMHIALPDSVEEELIAILSHACIDFMTSDLSTVPYNQEQCETFIKVIQNIPDSPKAEGYRNCVMARLWSEISGNYFVNLHGENNARLSRNQRLLPSPNIQTTRLIRLITRLAFNVPARYYEKLTDLWVDKISYAAHWRTFMASTLKEWRQISLWSMLLLMSSLIVFGISTRLEVRSTVILSSLQSISILSVLCCLTSICSSLVLVRLHQHHAEAHASEAVDFLENASHATYGLQPLAIAFAMPWFTFLWGFTSFAASVMLLSFGITSLPFQIFALLVMAIACVSGYIVFQYLMVGASSLSSFRFRVVFRPVHIIGRPIGVLVRYVDSAGVVVKKWVAGVRGRSRAGFQRVSTNDDV